MYISRGMSRTVVVFDKFVLKFPRIYFFRFLTNIFRFIKMGCFLKSWKWSIYSFGGAPRRLLFKGINDNWLEFYYYRKLKSPFLQPTYFSLFGFVNVQKTGKKPSVEGRNLWCQLHEITNGGVWADSHTFTNPNNFCEENGRLKMLDYGNRRIYDFLKKWGYKIHMDFNFSYDWEKRGKELYGK